MAAPKETDKDEYTGTESTKCLLKEAGRQKE